MSSVPQIQVPGWVALLRRPPALFVLVGLVVLGLLIYFKVDPGAIATGVIVFAVAGAVFYAGIAFTKRRDRKDVNSTLEGMGDAIVAQDNTPQARERVSKLRAKWDRIFKNIRPEYLKKKPILLVVGESKSGKSCLLDRSGLELESDNREERDWEEGTENVDPWLFPEGLVLDTAGEMVASQAGGARVDWPVLIGLIKKLRPRNPISGVVLAVPHWRLTASSDADRARQANSFQREFQRLVQGFGVRFPVTVVVTMSDLIDGYSEFARLQNAVHQSDSYTMLGWPQYELPNEFGARDAVAEAITGISDRLEAQVLHDICHPDGPTLEGREALEIWNFPKNLKESGQRLAEYLRIVFKEKESERLANAPFFRGLFFGSALQTIRREEPRRKEPERPASTPFHVRDLISVRLFGESGLVTTSGRAEAAIRYRRLVGIGVPLGCAVVSAAIAWVAADLAGRVTNQLTAFRQLAWAVNKDARPRIAADDSKAAGIDAHLNWIVLPENEGTAHPAEPRALAEVFKDAAGYKIDSLPWHLRWYSGFASRYEERARKAAVKAWEILVAEKLVHSALAAINRPGAPYCSDGGWALEQKDGNGGVGINPELARLDRALVGTLDLLAATQAGSQKTDATVDTSKPALLQLRLPAATAGGVAPSPTAQPTSLKPLYDAIVPTNPALDDGVEDLLQIPSGWRPSDSGSVAAGATMLAISREQNLEDRLATAIDPVLKAATRHGEWTKPADSTKASERWASVIADVWDGCLKEKWTDPGARLAAVAGYVDGLSGKDPVIGLLSRARKDGQSARTPEDLLQLATELKDLRALKDQAGIDLQSDGDKLVALINTLKNDKQRYTQGGLKARFDPQLGPVRGGAPEEAQTRRDGYLRPLFEEINKALALYLGNPESGFAKTGAPTLAPNPRSGALLPISNVSGTTSIQASKDNIQADLDFLEKKQGAFSVTSQEGKQVAAAVDRLKAAIVKVKGDAGAYKILDLAVLEKPADNLTGWLSDILGWTSTHPSSDPNVAEAVSTALANERAAINALLGPSGATSAQPATPMPEKVKVARQAIVDALQALRGSESTVDIERFTRRLAGEFLRPARDTASKDSSSTASKVEAAIQQLGDLPSQEERNYWDRFWREILGRSLLVRDAAVATFDVKKGEACGRFPLARDGQEELTFADLTALAGGPGIDVAAAVQGSANANELTKLIESKSLADVLASLKASPPASAGSDACTTSALRLSDLRPGAELALDCKVTIAVDYGVLPQGVRGEPTEVPKDWELADAASKTRLSHNAPLVTISGLGGDEIVTVGSESRDYPTSLSGRSQLTPATISFAPEIVPGRTPRQQIQLGSTWPALRLATLLRPLPHKSELTADGDGYWGTLAVTDDGDVVVFVRVEAAWVGSKPAPEDRKPINLNDWLRAAANAFGKHR